MQRISKKKRLGKRGRLIWSLALFTVSGIALFFGLRSLNKPPADRLPQGQAEAPVLIDRKEEDLLRFEVVSSKDDRFTLLRKGAGYVVQGQEDFPLDEKEVALMVRDLTVLHANEVLGEVRRDEASLTALGLGSAAPRVKAQYRDGQALTILFGRSTQEEIPADYLMVEGSGLLYTISPETRDHFDRDLNSLHSLPGINFNSALVDAVRVTGEDAFSLRNRDGLWEVDAPFVYPASAERVGAMLASVGKMRFALYAGQPDAAGLKSMGLDAPRRTVTFVLAPSRITEYGPDGQVVAQHQVDAQEVSIALGNDIAPIGLYCLYQGEAYQASNVSMGFLRDLRLDDLMSDTPVTLPVNRLDRLVVIEAGAQREYKVEMVEKLLPNGEIEQDALGNTLYEPLVSLGGGMIDSEAFLRRYLLLLGLKRAGSLPPGFTAQAGSALRVYRLVSGGETRELALFPYDALHYAMRVNGVFAHYISREAADAVGL